MTRRQRLIMGTWYGTDWDVAGQDEHCSNPCIRRALSVTWLCPRSGSNQLSVRVPQSLTSSKNSGPGPPNIDRSSLRTWPSVVRLAESVLGLAALRLVKSCDGSKSCVFFVDRRYCRV